MRTALAALLAVALWAVGCASFDGRGLVPGQSTEKDVEALMGVPAFRIKAANGDTVLYFSRQPTGRKNYAARIAPDGVLRGIDQLLTEQNIAFIVRDVSTREQVRQIVGPPWRTSRFERLQREVWEYNMINVTQWDYFLFVQFSDDGIVREVMMIKDYTKEQGGPSFMCAADDRSVNDISDTLRLLRESIRRYVEKEITPKAAAWEAQGFVPREVLRDMGKLGFLGLRFAEEYGGGALDARATALLAEELGRSTYGGFAITVLVHTDMATPHLINAGSPAQIRKYLPRIVAGECITAVAVTEPDTGSDVKSIRTSAKRVSSDPGGDWVLKGSKMFITNGALADLYFVAAKTDAAAGSKGISIFIVEKGTPGFSVGRRLDKMGWRCSDTAELVFDGCRVPAENLLGEENRGFYAIMKNFQNERVAIAAMAMGEAAKAIELTLEYVKTRKAFGAPLWDKQAIRQRLSLLAAKVEAGRQLVRHAASMDAEGRDCVKEVSMAKAYCAELLNEVVYDCLQFHGGFGYIKESTIERMYRDARVQTIGGGATEVMLEEVAKRL